MNKIKRQTFHEYLIGWSVCFSKRINSTKIQSYDARHDKKCTCNDKLNCEESIELRGLNIRSRMWIETKTNSILYTYRTTKERTMAVDIAVQTDAIKCRGNFLCLPFECAREFYAICFHSFFFIYCRSFAFSLNVS